MVQLQDTQPLSVSSEGIVLLYAEVLVAPSPSCRPQSRAVVGTSSFVADRLSEDLKAVVSELFDVEYLKINDSQLVQAAAALLLTSSCNTRLHFHRKEVERLVEKFSEILENNADKSGKSHRAVQ